MTQRELPSGWQWMTLGEVCEEYTGTVDPRRLPDQEFTYVDISSVDNNAKRIVEPKVLLGKDAPSRARQTIKANDVIVSTTRPNLNAVALVPDVTDGWVCSTGFCVLRARAGWLEPHYLFAYVQSDEFVKPLSDLVKGALYPAVTDRQVREQRIPLPPLAEQQRIAARLNAQLAAVAQARAAALAQVEAAGALPAAYFRQLFPSPQQPLPAEWRKALLGDILKRRNEVVHPYEKPQGKGVFVGLEHIESQTGRRIGALDIELAELTGRKPRFYSGDIVYGYLRPYLNKVWVADFDGYSSVDQYAFIVDSNGADVHYVAAYLRSPLYLALAPIDQTPGQLPRIRSEEVAGVPIPLPPLEQQRRIVARLAEQTVGMEQTSAHLRRQLASIEAMPAALLRAAFSGRL